MDNNMELTIRVTPGSVTQNFAEFKALVKEKLDNEYKNIDVTEESLQEARKARARLNEAKRSLKEQMRSASLQNDEPLLVPKAQAKELEELLDEAIETLDVQIKGIENKRRDEKFLQGMGIFEQVFSEAPQEVRELAKQCKWICKPQWGNATYSAKEVREDCERALFEIKSALALLTGQFAPQMLEVFKEKGSISEAQLEGKRMEKVIEDNKAFFTNQSMQAPIPDQSEMARNSIVVDSTPYTVNPPTFYRRSDEDDRLGSVDIRFKGTLYQIRWLRSICKTEGIEMEVLGKKGR